MSKKVNTLLNYFSKSPATKKKGSNLPSTSDKHVHDNEDQTSDKSNNNTPKNCTKNSDSTLQNLNKRKLHISSEDDCNEVNGIQNKDQKRRRLMTSDNGAESEPDEDHGDFSASDDEYKPSRDELSSDSSSSENCSSSSSDENTISSLENTPTKAKSKGIKKRLTGGILKNDKDTKSSCMNLETFKFNHKSVILNNTDTESHRTMKMAETKNSETGEEVSNNAQDEPLVWPHQTLDFLKSDKIRDKEKRRPDHPDYDPKTLHVPKEFLDKLSPGVRQWWVLKSDHFDCVLLFKVGKFYELYHMDAEVGVKELGFTFMRGEFAHSGFPEVSYDKMASILIDRGYKIARVEQTETPEMMANRCKLTKPTKFDRVVKREICQISNKGTQVFGLQSQITPNHQYNYVLSIIEKNENKVQRFGICYGDTSIGDFYIGEFDDDKSCSRLLTLLAHNTPVLILHQKDMSECLQIILRGISANALKESLTRKFVQKWDAGNVLKYLAENYYKDDNWPMDLRIMQAEEDHLGITPKESYKLALSALGILVGYMINCQIAEKVIPMARMYLYDPPDGAEKCGSDALNIKTPSSFSRKHMVLDSATISNLNVTGEYSLLNTLDNCCTKFGKRLLHHWLCAPSCDIEEILRRQHAITEFLKNEKCLQEVRALLAPMPDFERHLAQIHLFGSKLIAQNHADGRAILFEEKIYNKKKIQNFIAVLKGLDMLLSIPSLLSGCDSSLIIELSQLPSDGGVFPDMTELLNFFKNAFDHDEASKNGVIAPEIGVDAEYDEAQNEIKEINIELKTYLQEQEKFFGCRLSYFGTDKKRYQLEVPESHAHKAAKSYYLESQRKGKNACRRYSTRESKNLLKKMQNAEDKLKDIQKDLLRRIFEKFSNHFDVWKRCVDCVAKLDVLASLSEYARNQYNVCVPEIECISPGAQPFVEVEEGYHPCVSSDTYIPNGVVLGINDVAPLCILTGPNMGGKSTLMRQIGLLVIMAQIGSHVPAQKLRTSLVDRIFTRIGAKDDIISGQSTFLVELNETSIILKHATIHSLVLLDELGRGTATYDGTAIAASVVHYIGDLKCRTLFSTHYHNLVDYFITDARVIFGHMGFVVENNCEDDPTEEMVTFLYKYTNGPCPKSYGFNAARLAGIPCSIVSRAIEISKQVEIDALKRRIAHIILTNSQGESFENRKKDIEIVKDLLTKLKSLHKTKKAM